MPSQEADSYGTVQGVAAYVRVYTEDGVFSTNTNPTANTVARWIDQVSDIMNLCLADKGFSTPIVQVDAVSSISMVVEQLVSDLVAAANSNGRFFSTRFTDSGLSITSMMRKDVCDWVEANANGLESSGVPRTAGTLGHIGTRGVDNAGDEIFPIFQRKQHGNRFQNWDT
jgi:hypothetical protein